MTKKADIGTPKIIYQIKVTLNYIAPLIWRRIHVPAEMSLEKCHRILQTALGWTNTHLYEFAAGSKRYGLPNSNFAEDIINVKSTSLRNVMPVENRKISYLYDFGDGWEHEIVLEKITPNVTDYQRVICSDGARACPPEDCGGVPGYEDILVNLNEPLKKRDKDLMIWLDGYDPECFDLNEVNKALKRFKV
jgi:Plasmid pRiA4b ORF-3-like protein